jgi:hypothetical protein
VTTQSVYNVRADCHWIMGCPTQSHLGDGNAARRGTGSVGRVACGLKSLSRRGLWRMCAP